MSRPRIVLDTNVLISAALQPHSVPAQVLELIAMRAVELCISEELLAEYREVFSRTKFAGLDSQLVARLLKVIVKSPDRVSRRIR
jgi:putative PIN family toxin of toxin-antitoxin system